MDPITVSLDPHVWQNVLEALESATPVTQAEMTNKERLAWYERSHAITIIRSAIPRRRRTKTNGQVEEEA